MKKVTVLSAASAVLGVLCIAYYILCGILYSFDMSGLWIWPSFALIMFFGCLWKYAVEPKIDNKHFRIYKHLKRMILTVFALFMLAFITFECFLIAEWCKGNDRSNTKADVVIILGSTVEYDKPGEALEWRIATAFEVIKENPYATVIACGGFGEDDIITEAECIKRELTELGIAEDRIIKEERSTSTAENFKYAAELFPDTASSAAVVTSGFHCFRALMVGRASFAAFGITDVALFPVSSPCTSVQLPRNMVREFAACVKGLMKSELSV